MSLRISSFRVGVSFFSEKMGKISCLNLHSQRSFSTVKPGDIFSRIFSPLEEFPLVPQHGGTRKNIVLSSDNMDVQYAPLSHLKDTSWLFSNVMIPMSPETGLKGLHAVITEHVFTINKKHFDEAEKHGSSKSSLSAIEQAQKTQRVFHWRHSEFNPYWREQFYDEIVKAHPDYHLVQNKQTFTLKDLTLLKWDERAIAHIARKFNPQKIPPYLVGPPRMYTSDEPWGKEFLEGIKKNLTNLEKTIKVRDLIMKDVEDKNFKK